jgi:CheY-like chemotaxis protein
MDKRVLVVDDDEAIRDVLQVVLESAEYSVDVAADGLVALMKLEAGAKPDLILLDVMMPRMDGITFVRELQQRGLRHAIPIVLLSAHIRTKEAVSHMGLEGFISKPFEIDDVLNLVERLTAVV